jgi:hypothetical protein
LLRAASVSLSTLKLKLMLDPDPDSEKSTTSAKLLNSLDFYLKIRESQRDVVYVG